RRDLFEEEAPQQVLRAAQAVLRARAHVGQRFEILRERDASACYRGLVDTLIPQRRFRARRARRNRRHAAIGDADLRDATFLVATAGISEFDRECGAYGRDILVD